MSWSDTCGNCGASRADCDCGNWSIVKTNQEIMKDNKEQKPCPPGLCALSSTRDASGFKMISKCQIEGCFVTQQQTISAPSTLVGDPVKEPKSNFTEEQLWLIRETLIKFVNENGWENGLAMPTPFAFDFIVKLREVVAVGGETGPIKIASEGPKPDSKCGCLDTTLQSTPVFG